jgi:hypothetical protein
MKKPPGIKYPRNFDRNVVYLRVPINVRFLHGVAPEADNLASSSSEALLQRIVQFQAKHRAPNRTSSEMTRFTAETLQNRNRLVLSACFQLALETRRIVSFPKPSLNSLRELGQILGQRLAGIRTDETMEG